MEVFCSVASGQTLPQARVLAGMLRAHHPGARLVVCVVDAHVDEQTRVAFDVALTPQDLGRDESGDGEHPNQLNPEALPARLLRWAFKDGADVAVYLSPCLAIYAPLDPAIEKARTHGLVLVRRTSRLPEDDQRPNYADLLAAGPVNPGFVAAAGTEGERFARWWVRGVAQTGAPGRWLEVAQGAFPATVWLDDRGFGVGLWNLHERAFERRGDAVDVAGQPLRFVDFTGFRPDRRYTLAEFASRVRPADDPVLAELCGDYAERLLGAGWEPPSIDLGDRPRLGNGIPTDSLMSGLWVEAQESGVPLGDPSSPLAADAFASWLRGPAPHGGARGVNRYLHAVYRRRRDLQLAFPDLGSDADAGGLIAWGWDRGREELGLVSELLPRTPDQLAEYTDPHLTVNVFGYLRDTLGIAEAARLYIRALEAAGVPYSTTAVAPDLPIDLSQGKTLTRFGHHAYEEVQAPFEPEFNLVCLNGDQLTQFIRAGGADLLGDRITIGNWGWETDVLPPSWAAGFQYVDEIWVYSNFVARNLARLSPVPVVVIPQAIATPDPTGIEVDLIDERFTFLFMFDYFSTLQRKNPLGLIEAFKRAFPPDAGPRLLLKTINEKFRRDAAAELRAAIGDRRDIHLVDRFLETREIAALVAQAGCYVSLHRSEGFGLTLADALVLQTPVIATAYSGNLDFMTERNSYLVDWSPSQVGPGSDIYPAEGFWAEPDLDHAAELMRHVWEHQTEAAQKAARGRRDIERQYSPAAAGRVIRARLAALREAGRNGQRAPTSNALKVIEQELTLDLRHGVASRRTLAGPIRRAAMRMMLPFTVHERNLDRAVFDALRDLRAELERERARGARVRTRLRRVEDRLTGAAGSRRGSAEPAPRAAPLRRDQDARV